MEPIRQTPAMPDGSRSSSGEAGIKADSRLRAGDSSASILDATRARSIALWLERTSQPFLATSLEGRIMFANRAFLEMIGYDESELRKMTVQELTPPQWRVDTQSAMDRILATGRSFRYEKAYRRSDGKVVPIDLTIDLDIDERGLPIGFFAFVTDISERKQVENALRQSEERFRRLYDDAPVGYHSLDADGRIVNINRTECEMLGLSREELIGRSYFEFVPEEVREETRSVFLAKIQGGEIDRAFECCLLTCQGRALTVSIEERIQRDETGAVTGVLGTTADITEWKRAEMALVAAERRSRALFEGIEDAVFVHSPEGFILDVNPAATRLLGYSREELLGMKTSDVDAPDFAAGYPDRLEEQLRQGHLSFEGRHRAKSGRIVPVDINTSTIQFDNERAVLAVIRDITDHKALEETQRRFAEERLENARQIEAKNLALTRSEARYRLLTEGCLDAVVVADQEGCISLFNPAAEKTFGYRADEILGRPLTVIMPQVYAGMGLKVSDPNVQKTIVGRTIETPGVRQSGEEFPLELSLSAIELAGELQFIGSVRDQTERHRMRAMLTQSEKLASIGLLSAGVAHEINNPLAYVANNLAVLERDVKGVLQMLSAYEEGREHVNAAAPELYARIQSLADELDWNYVQGNMERMLGRTREGVQRVANIVQTLRGLARTSPAKMEPASIPDLLESALEMMRGRLRRHNIEVVVDHGEVPRITCVGTQISQVILNLLINASQAIEATGRTEGGTIQFSSRKEGTMAHLSIRDNGCGIVAENLPRLFDPFYTTKPVGEGTGLGLSISHGIVSGHGGRLEVESQVNEGTCFHVYIPLGQS